MVKTKHMLQEAEASDKSNREYKSSVFTAYFGIPKHAADLYCALEHAEHVGPEDIAFTTLEGVLYMARKNDMAFTAKKKVLVIGEHQSTINLNMPLRSAIYYGRTMERLVPQTDIYKAKRILIPTPEFYMFYNGTKKQPAEKILKLSDSYLEKTDFPMLELKVKMININPDAQHPILQESRSLMEYSFFIQKIREKLQDGMKRGDAIKYAMEECLAERIMEDFIHDYGSEVVNMLFGEFNLEDARAVWKEEAHEDGVTEGERRILVRQTCKKLKKGKTIEVIVDEVEENPTFVREICEIAKTYAPEYDEEKIFDAWRQEHEADE